LAIVISGSSMLAVAVFARSYWSLLALLLVASLANSIGQLAANTALSQGIPRHRQGLVFGLKQCAVPMSTLLAGAAVPVFALTIGWRWAWGVAGLLAFASWFFVQPSKQVAPTGSRSRTATVPLVVIGVAATFAAGPCNALSTFLVSSSVEQKVAPAAAGLILTAGSALCMSSRIFLGWLADRRSSAGGGRPIFLLAGMLAFGAIGMALLSIRGGVPLAAGTLLGFGLGWAWPGLMNLAVVQLHSSSPASATAITQTGIYVGAFIGPVVLGTVAAATSYRVTWIVAAGSMALAAVGMLLGYRMLRSAPSSPEPIVEQSIQPSLA
jgi:MFS family permease